jgi:hypothetical protein
VPEFRDMPVAGDPEAEPPEFPADAISYDARELPAATRPAFDTSIFDGLPVDEEGVPVLPADFDWSQLPGHGERS